MNIFKLSIRNMMNRPLSTMMSLILLTLGVGMIALLLNVNKHIQEQMENNIRGIDMVVGAKGSPLQLILSAVYHIDVPTGNIAMQEVEELKRNRYVASTVPLSYGDTFQGYRIVGTDYSYTNLYNAELEEGRLWEHTFEVTIGATVAQNLGLVTGDKFVSSHGFAEGGGLHESNSFKVVGVLSYTNSVLDQLILTATESIWEVHTHEEDNVTEVMSGSEGGDHLEEEREDPDHSEDREITAMLVKFRSPVGLIQIPRSINEDTNMQAAVPAFEVNRLFGLLGVGVDTINAIALVIMIVSGLSIFISLYSTLKDRQYEMALMRTHGATRLQLVWLIVQEGMLLTLSGFLLGIVFSRIGLWLVSNLMKSNFHYEFNGFSWVAEERWLLVIAACIGFFASLIPSISVYRINISKILSEA
ncbi:MAG: ABC transporter permease [Cyclobacteriaceae bacterium]